MEKISQVVCLTKSVRCVPDEWFFSQNGKGFDRFSTFKTQKGKAVQKLVLMRAIRHT